MKKLVLGSLNIDCTYRVRRFVQPGETIAVKEFRRFCGGKGFNQAVALSRAGSDLFFAGVIGSDGELLRRELASEGISAELLRRSDGPSGHAVIQVNESGENCIMVVAGSNAEVSREYIDEVLARFSAGDLIVLQNEVPNVGYAIEKAHRRGMRIAFNPSPFNAAIDECGLDRVDFLLINKVEGSALTGEAEPDGILGAIRLDYPNLSTVLTLGAEGALFQAADGERFQCEAVRTAAVDATAAGDTFAGYFLTEYLDTRDGAASLEIAAAAAAIAVSRHGAASSIPARAEVAAAMENTARALRLQSPHAVPDPDNLPYGRL